MTDCFPEKLFRHLVDNLNTGVMVDDSQGRIYYTNKTFRDIFRLESKQLEFFDFADFTAPEYRNDLLKLHLRRLSGKSVPNSVDFTGIRTDGTRVQLEASVSMLHNGDKVFFLTILKDVSKAIAASAVYSQNRDFETSRCICISIMDSIGVSHSPEELSEKLNFLNSYSVESISPVDAGKVLQETVRFIRDTGNSNIKVSVSLDPDIPRAMASAGLLRHLVRNAVRNALDVLGHKGHISLRAGFEERADGVSGRDSFVHVKNWIFIELKDNGSGMTEEVLKRAPEPFFTTKNRLKHGGMGLFEVFQGMRVIQGYASLSSAPNSGTVVRFFMPYEH